MRLDGRRRFLAGICALLAAARATAQPPRNIAQRPRARIGFLATGSPASSAKNRQAFFAALRDRGWIENENLTVDIRFANGELSQHDRFARELIALAPQLVFAPTQSGADAMMRLTRSIPIVFVIVPDPIGSGFATSLAHPGANATGLATVNVELGGKRIALLKEAFPATRRVVLLFQPELDMNRSHAAAVESAATAIGLQVTRVAIAGLDTFDAALVALDAARPDAIYVAENPPVYTHRQVLIARLAERRLPVMYGLQDFVLEGGLMTYAMSFPDQFRRAADYVDKILNGAKPGDLPIQQPINFELVINMKTARAQGLSFPQSILLRADRVIE